jgi:uncharacterized protein DUF2730
MDAFGHTFGRQDLHCRSGAKLAELHTAQSRRGAVVIFDWVDILIKFISLAISLLAIAVAVFRTRRQHLEDAFEDIDGSFKAGSKRMDAHGLRIHTLEQSFKEMPKKDDMHQLELTLKEISGDMKALRATMRGMSESMTRTEHIVGRHEDHLLNKGKN